MKTTTIQAAAVIATALCLVSCGRELQPQGPNQPATPAVQSVNPFDAESVDYYYGYAEISVPAGTSTVYLKYTTAGGVKEEAVSVKPIITVPTDGKDVEPFGTVKILFKSPVKAQVSMYYTIPDAPASLLTKAGEEQTIQVYSLSDFPTDQIAFGEFGKTRYVQMPWSFAWENSEATGWQSTPTYPKDVVLYDAEHNHTLRYKFAYAGVMAEAYFLEDCYEFENNQVTAIKHLYDHGCGDGCPYCMPWGCSCGCGAVNSAFVGSGDLTASAADALVVDPSHGDIRMGYAPADVTSITLNEPSPYITKDAGKTNYHSSGVVMFDDRWPALPHEGSTAFRYDYNDVVVDYDIEAMTQSAELAALKGWDEQLKVTLHVRAVGGDDAYRVGMALENFDMDYVASVEEFKTLDSWQNTHGQLPEWTVTTLQENSLHYDNSETAIYKNNNNLRPSIEIGGLQRLNSKDGQWSQSSGKNSGNEVYQYIDDSGAAVDHVFNPARKLYSAWGGPHTEQYAAEALDPAYALSGHSISGIQTMKLYNTIPGYVNVAGGLYTYTVIYKIKPRGEMTPEQAQKCLANMVDAVVNTTAQNFFIVKQDYGAVGLKGYAPLDYPVKDFKKGYKAKYEEIVAKNAANMDPSTYYLASNGMVWAFKCPTLTRHSWELMPFSLTYPYFEEWVASNGSVHSDWYTNGDGSLMSCWW